MFAALNFVRDDKKAGVHPAFFFASAAQQVGSTEPVLTACTVLTNEVQYVGRLAHGLPTPVLAL